MARRERREAKPLNRRVETRLPRKTLLVFCEGKRAQKLDEMHQRNDTAFPKNNPSSGMHELLAAVESHLELHSD